MRPRRTFSTSRFQIRVCLVTALVGALAACGREEAPPQAIPQEYDLTGQVLAVDAARQQVTIKHEDIVNFMPGMTMTFRVRETALLDGIAAGDLVKGRLVVTAGEAHLSQLTRTGHAPVPEGTAGPPAPRGVEPGDTVRDAAFLDETGTPRRLADWRGKALAVAFTYTRCPVPTFCPLLERHLRAAQETIGASPALKDRVQLLSVTLDPEYDRPPVLQAHAAALKADPARWRFLTGSREPLKDFAAQFGVNTLPPSEGSAEIVHNLRTAVVDPEGRLVSVLSGTDWRPDDLVRELERAAGRQ